ncbi:PLP-dependent aminotransferase family protein [Coraliomargarita parva]|uniref:aminotransferase-like domain-containing protein n=1 Tax=Coraliomargarita parva TaxID=3014050 RepID=UPI0022B486CF|nr:PLP-dependent aminotransferase family protein [Coraliomargarita parva]
MKADNAQPSIHFSTLGGKIETPVIVDLMARALSNPALLSLAAGFTDNEVLPKELVGDCVAALTAAAQSNEALQYGSNQGRLRLRELTCEFLATYPGERSSAFQPDDVFITNGSQQALYMAAQTLCDPGDIVLVQEPSYFVCLEMLRGLGLRPVGMPCDPAGAIIADELEGLLAELERKGERDRVKAVYLVSYFGNPSSRSMPAAEKQAMADCLRSHGFIVPVIEDAAYRELYYDAPYPAPTIFTMPAFDCFPKLYLGTYTKPFATGLKIGYGICSHAAWRDKMLCMKGHQDFGSSHFNQAIIERVLDQGLYAAHLSNIQGHYAGKATVLNDALEASGLRAGGWHWEKPGGGLIFWLRGPAGADLRMDRGFCTRCIDSGVLYVPGDLCFTGGNPLNYARVSTGALPPDKIRIAVERFAQVALSD